MKNTNSKDFWYGKRVLITGGDGFVAANLAKKLVELDAVVTIIVRHQRPINTIAMLGQSAPDVDIEVSDMDSFIDVQKICNRHQIDTIFHLAASAIVSEAANAPITTFQNNITPTLNLLEVARINNIPRILVASTDKSYGDHADADDSEPLPYKENQALRGLDVYSASKVCADLITQTYGFQFDLPVLIIRSCNIYGPGDLNFTRLIPRTVLRLLAGHTPVINAGNAEVKREYVYIEDLVGAYLYLAENLDKHYQQVKPKRGRATYGWAGYNVGSYHGTADADNFDSIRTVLDVIGSIQKSMGFKAEAATIPKPDNFIEIPDQYLDSSKLHELGFTPTISFDEGLKRTIQWYKDNSDELTKLGAKYVID